MSVTSVLLLIKNSLENIRKFLWEIRSEMGSCFIPILRKKYEKIFGRLKRGGKGEGGCAMKKVKYDREKYKSELRHCTG